MLPQQLFRIPDLGIQVSGFGFRNSSIRFPVCETVGFWSSGLTFGVWGLGFRVEEIGQAKTGGFAALEGLRFGSWGSSISVQCLGLRVEGV